MRLKKRLRQLKANPQDDKRYLPLSFVKLPSEVTTINWLPMCLFCSSGSLSDFAAKQSLLAIDDSLLKPEPNTQFMNSRITEIAKTEPLARNTTRILLQRATFDAQHGFPRFLFIFVAAALWNIRNIPQRLFYVAFYPQRQNP